MHDVISTITRSDGLLLAASFACFAVAGVATGTVDALAPTAAATVLAIGGVYGVARYATRVTRRRLVVLSLGFWSAFIGIGGLHAVGLETVAAAVPGATGAVVTGLTAVTWATLLAACATTIFLGFREYGTTTGTDVPEDQMLESDSDYSTR